MAKKEILQITVRVRDIETQRFLRDKLEDFKRKGAKNASMQKIIEGLIQKWVEEETKRK